MKSDKRSGSYLAVLQSLEDIKIIIIDVKKTRSTLHTNEIQFLFKNFPSGFRLQLKLKHCVDLTESTSEKSPNLVAIF